jgi:Multidrug resistance efflux pump
MSNLFIYNTDKMKKVALFAIVMVMLNSCKDGDSQYIVEEHTINEAVYASGELFPEKYHFLKPTKSTVVLQILAEKDDLVSVGDILVITGNSDEKDKIRLASDQVAIAENNIGENSAILREIQRKIEVASQQYQLDKTNAERYHDLSATNAVSQEVAENKILTAEKSLLELNSLQEQYIIAKNQLRNQLVTAELQLANIFHQHTENIIRSNISGKVYSVFKQPGEIINGNTPVLMVGTDNIFKLELYIDERDIEKVKIGQAVYFETNTYPEKQFEAVIVKVDPVMQKDTRYFKVEASIHDSISFYPQSSVEAAIVIRKNAKVLMIPFDYLNNGDSVLMQSRPKNRMVHIKTGIRINNMIEVEAGIEKGTIILKNAEQ